MEIDPKSTGQIANFVILIAALFVISIGLGALTFLTIQAADVTDDVAVRKLLAELAWVAVALLGLTLVVLMWSVMRFVRSRITVSRTHTRTPYVDAWAEAGRRYQLTEEDLKGEYPGAEEDDEREGSR